MIKLHSLDGEVSLKWWTFPGGERSVRIEGTLKIPFHPLIVCHFKSSNDLIDVLLLNNALRNKGIKNISLVIPYFPFARQDRVMVDGEPFALQVAVQLIKSCNFDTITIKDPHSDVLAGMFEPGQLIVLPQWDLWAKEINKELNIDESRAYDDEARSYPNPCLVSPDAGALKKIYKLSAKTGNTTWERPCLPVVEAGKQRDVTTGNIVATTIDSAAVMCYNTFFVVDDICDGGRTFIELAKVIKEANPLAKLVLCVTHGIFSKGKEVLNEVYDEVWCINDLSVVE
jgi:ribose-phosphate pyrophosphokinase